MHSFWGVPSGDGLCAAGAGAVSAREKGGHGDSACWPVSLRGRPRPRVGNVEPGADSSLPLNDTDDHSHYPEPPVPRPPTSLHSGEGRAPRACIPLPHLASDPALAASRRRPGGIPAGKGPQRAGWTG